jgi:hypothetical protein
MIAKISAPLLMRAFDETSFRRNQIQGFNDGTRHWVRDCTLPEGQQVRWTQHAPIEKYEEMHALKVEEIRRLEMQVVCEWLVENSPVTNTDI